MATRDPGSALRRLARRLLLCLALLSPAAALAQEALAAPVEEGELPSPEPAAAPDKFLFWSDTSISALPWGTGFAVDPEDQTTFTLEHAHGSKIGDFFGFVDFNHFHDAPPGVSDDTWYMELGPRLSLGKLSGEPISYAFFDKSLFEIKDVLLAFQYERGEDSDVAEAVLMGIGFDLDVRKMGLLGRLGKFNFVQLNFYARSELTKGVENGFHDMQITASASYPFKMGQTDWLLDGFFDWVLGIGDEDWSYHLNPQLTVDLGKVMTGEPGKFYAGIEVDWWWNKYQIPDSPAFDTDQSAVSLLFKYHF